MVKIQLNKNGLPLLGQFSADGFVDCVFKIVQVRDANDFYELELRADYENTIVGFNAEVLKDISCGFDENMNLIQGRTYYRGVKFHRSGIESDALMSALARLYGLDFGNCQMVQQETYTAICLHQGDIDLATESVRLKIFGKDEEPFVEDDYYESFFNLDIPSGYLFWNEKDADYRTPLLRALTVSQVGK